MSGLRRAAKGQDGGSEALAPEGGQVMSAVVYRMYSASGVLLYIGATVSAPTRVQQHIGVQPWASEVDTIRVQHFPSREEAFFAEADAIRAERPQYNRLTPPKRTARRERIPNVGRPRIGEIREKPWLAENMSRATWFRRKAEAKKPS